MSSDEQQRAADWFAQAAGRPEEWEDVARPERLPRPGRKLGAQITIRLEPEIAERLRVMADGQGIGYTSLARRMLEDAVRRTAPAEWLTSSSLHIVRREGVWALIREGERCVVFANSDKDVVVQWSRDIAAAEGGTVTVHEPEEQRSGHTHGPVG